MTPDNKELAQSPDQFLEMEHRDEAQILAEIQGNILSEMFYISRDGKAVVSWIGIKEIARKYGGIDVNLSEKADLGEQWMVVVKATDKKNGYSMLGASTQAKLMDVHDFELDEKGRYKLDEKSRKIWAKDEKGDPLFHKEPDPFVLQKAMSKAQRNAIRALVPETFFAQMINTWRQVGKTLPPPKSPQAYARPPPKKVDSSPKVKEETPPAFVNAADLPKVPEDFRPTEETGYAIDYIVENFGQTLETVRALVYREMNAVEPHLTDTEAVKVVREMFETKQRPEANADVTEEDIVYNALQGAALDGELVVVVEAGKLMTRFKKGSADKREFLGDRWNDYNIALKPLGYGWVKAGADSHWEKA